MSVMAARVRGVILGLDPVRWTPDKGGYDDQHGRREEAEKAPTGVLGWVHGGSGAPRPRGGEDDRGGCARHGPREPSAGRRVLTVDAPPWKPHIAGSGTSTF